MVTYKRILFCTDFSEGAQEALPVAVDLAKKYGAELHLIHVYQEPVDLAQFETKPPPETNVGLGHLPGTETDKKLEAICREIEADLGACRKKMLRGRAVTEIVRYARESGIDLIVMATHKLSGFEHALFGSTAEQVLKESPCNVFVVKKRGK